MDITFMIGFAAGGLVAGVLVAVVQRRKLAQMEELFDRMFDLQARQLFEATGRLSLIRDLTVDGDGMDARELVKDVYDIATNGVPKEREE